MNKKFGLMLLAPALWFFTAQIMFAQSDWDAPWTAPWYESNKPSPIKAPQTDNSKVFINAGVGFGIQEWFSLFEKLIPPLSVSADFKLSLKFPFTLGAMAVFSKQGPQSEANSYEEYTYEKKTTYSNMGFAGRIGTVWSRKNWGFYIVFALGYFIQNVETKHSGTGDYEHYVALEDEPSNSIIFIGASTGIQWFFIKNIGFYVEANLFLHTIHQVVGAGLSLRF
ncbi:MAG: hypothetical protein LBG72_07085 [Spirochaetaceae bacterium]|jgi:hypothetical protein|nr:hypothetical protein [Spirochaetaceae bacterium]